MSNGLCVVCNLLAKCGSFSHWADRRVCDNKEPLSVRRIIMPPPPPLQQLVCNYLRRFLLFWHTRAKEAMTPKFKIRAIWSLFLLGSA
mmetsp:Transcript_25736/g.43750  ORF Transcript_25736/g.43750 Transcript_25736/m.43750 type:complete len:88 (-) Transcript_25736:1013-1276(-)